METFKIEQVKIKDPIKCGACIRVPKAGSVMHHFSGVGEKGFFHYHLCHACKAVYDETEQLKAILREFEKENPKAFRKAFVKAMKSKGLI